MTDFTTRASKIIAEFKIVEIIESGEDYVVGIGADGVEYRFEPHPFAPTCISVSW